MGYGPLVGEVLLERHVIGRALRLAQARGVGVFDDSHDLDLKWATGATMHVFADGVLISQEVFRKRLIHDGDWRSVRAIGFAKLATGNQRRPDGMEVAGADGVKFGNGLFRGVGGKALHGNVCRVARVDSGPVSAMATD